MCLSSTHLPWSPCLPASPSRLSGSLASLPSANPRTEPSPEEKATSIINSVPQTSLFTKTSGVLLGTGLTAAAISSELYVANEETVLAVGFLVILGAIASSIGAPYNSWANGHIDVS